jgi:hypothetical protein
MSFAFSEKKKISVQTENWFNLTSLSQTSLGGGEFVKLSQESLTLKTSEPLKNVLMRVTLFLVSTHLDPSLKFWSYVKAIKSEKGCFFYELAVLKGLNQEEIYLVKKRIKLLFPSIASSDLAIQEVEVN